MALHDCPGCACEEAEVVVTAAGTNEHDVAIAEAEAHSAEVLAEAMVDVAEVEAEARVEIAQAEGEARVAEAGERGETEEAVAEINAEVRVAEAEASEAQAEALADVAEAAADVAIAEAEGEPVVIDEPEHAEPDGDEVPAVTAVMVPPQLQEGGRPAARSNTRTVSAFRRRRGGTRR